ncbi:MAG: hypothetical protein SFV15_24105 [Polyangiaceae bacterium]|nr:hypothetical protein [Polyangiaceae bacterium]
MIISMQGNWTITVKSKNASFDQRFIVSGAATGNGTYSGTVGVTAHVTGSQWSIAVQNNPGTGFRLSKAQIKFPHKVGSNYVFEIGSEDAGDDDFNDLVLTCSTPATINDFILYGNVTLYSGRCIFNPCRRFPFVIDTAAGLSDALKNAKLRDLIESLYPERVPFPIPNPPDPGPFKPVVLDLSSEATQPKMAQVFQRVSAGEARSKETEELSVNNFSLLKTVQAPQLRSAITAERAGGPLQRADNIAVASVIDGLLAGCSTEPADNITLSFEEYDRTAAELAGGAYTGTGNRQLFGDTITDVFGNYIFRFKFDMTFPGISDSMDIAPGEDINVVAYPDIIVKVTGFAPYEVLYESAPYYNVPNLKRINLCLPKSSVPATAACFNGNLLGSLGNVFIGGNQNTSASTTTLALRRYGYGNHLEANGKISVGSSLALFNVECAAWGGVIDMRGCMYDSAKPADQNLIKWYTIRIRRQGTSNWTFVSQNYKHPKFSKRNLPNYIGDDVGPFITPLHVDGLAATNVAAYKNIQREIFADGVDWEFSNFDRFMQLNTGLYDLISGVVTPGTFYVRIDGYDAAGNPVPNATDLIPLYIHNRPLAFQLLGPSFADPSILNSGCGLYRLTEAQMNTPMQLSFKANDPEGFVDSYALTMGRCPAPMLALKVNSPTPPLTDTISGASTLSAGSAATHVPINVHNACPGYTGTLAEFSDAGLITVDFQPAASEGGWVKSSEYFTVLSFTLTAYKRVTNGYNTGLSGQYWQGHSIYLERFSP